jgi:hypothetical protein
MSARTKTLLATVCIGLLIIAGLFLWQRQGERNSRGLAPAALECRSNLREIDGGKQQWMIEHQKTTNDIPTWDDLRRYLSRRGDTVPTCPSGGTYTIGRLSEPPRCSYPEHTLY